MVKVAKKSKKSTKTSRKDLKQPDQFIEVTTKGAELAGSYRTQIIAGTLALVIIVGAVYFFQSYSLTQATDASVKLADAVEILDAEVKKPDPKKAKSPIRLSSDDDKKTYPSEKEKNEAAIKAFQKVTKTHSGSSAGTLAHLYMGNTYHRMGEYQKASEQFKIFLQRISPSDPLRYLGVAGLARTQEALKQPKLGLVRLQEYKDKGAKRTRPFALMYLAEYYQRQKDYKQARTYFKQIADNKDAPSDYRTIAQRRLAVLP